jgi:hypothetical protein
LGIVYCNNNAAEAQTPTIAEQDVSSAQEKKEDTDKQDSRKTLGESEDIIESSEEKQEQEDEGKNNDDNEDVEDDEDKDNIPLEFEIPIPFP